MTGEIFLVLEYRAAVCQLSQFHISLLNSVLLFDVPQLCWREEQWAAHLRCHRQLALSPPAAPASGRSWFGCHQRDALS